MVLHPLSVPVHTTVCIDQVGNPALGDACPVIACHPSRKQTGSKFNRYKELVTAGKISSIMLTGVTNELVCLYAHARV